MLRELHAFASSHACDVALCTVDPSAFGAAQQARRLLLGARSADRLGRLYRLRAPVDLVTKASVDRYEAEVDRLALLLLNGQTSLFLGAGVSINAGLPSWAALIDLLALELAISPEDRKSLARLNPLEAASLCAARAGSEAELKRLCARIVGSAKRHSLQHALLAGLPFKGCVTTNFDELFELAVRGAGAEMAVLPTDVGRVTDRWCLKLHGTVSRPGSIVLTRADYASYSKEQAASQGVLQGLLLTQHVLFVGFSMRDENWCRIVETVRGSVAPAQGRAAHRPDEEAVAEEEAAAWREVRSADASASYSTTANADLAAGVTGQSVGTMLPLQADAMFDALWRPMLHVTPIDAINAPHLPQGGAAHAHADGASHGGSDGCSGGAEPVSAEQSAEASAPPAASEQQQQPQQPQQGQQQAQGQHAPSSEIESLARRLEIFLDHVASAVESRRCRVLLNPKYASLLTPRSLALSKAVTAFLDDLPPDAIASGPFQPILRLFLRMGLRTSAMRELLGDHTLEGPYRARMEKLVALERRSPLEQREQKTRKKAKGSGEQATKGKARPQPARADLSARSRRRGRAKIIPS